MALVTKVFTPGNIFQGPADVYLDLGAPPSAVPPVQYTNTLTLDSSGQPSDTGSAGIHLGLTEGPASLAWTEKFEEIRADQLAAAVDAAFISAMAEIDFNVKETNLSRLKKFFAGPNTGAYFDLPIGITNPAADMLQIGAMRSSAVQFHTLLLVAPRRDATGKYLYILAYRALLVSAIAAALDRKKETVYKLKFKCLADVSRVAKDQTMQIVWMP